MIQIEVWSDIVCPFCPIGKRHLETALARFPHRDQVQVRLRSFELDPHAQRQPGRTLTQLLASKYGRSEDWAQQMHDRMAEQARSLGLDYRFDIAKPTNTFDAHRLIHLAARHGKQDAAEERLFSAYYTRGEHIGDHETLTRIGAELGLPLVEVQQALASDDFVSDVRRDEREAQEAGVQGVPFFLLNGKYAVSGAQPVEVFMRALQKTWDDQAEPLGTTPLTPERDFQARDAADRRARNAADSAAAAGAVGGTASDVDDATACGPEGCEVR